MGATAFREEDGKKVIKSGTFFRCFCPHCHMSLIESDNIVMTVVRPGGERGVLTLSPYLNVFESTSTVRLPEGEEVEDFICPHCAKSLKEPEKRCGACGAHIMTLLARVETEVFDFHICMRKSCYWHGITTEKREKLLLEMAGFRKPGDHVEMIRTGTKLQCFCPNCKASLVKGEDLVVHILGTDGRIGELRLSPYLNVFRNECSIFIPPGAEVEDMICPQCKGSLWLNDKRCEVCDSKAAKMRIRASVLDLDFYICMRDQCHWHGLSEGDRQRILLDESLEW
ncbi:MAG: hypothetical protein KA419_06695 [Acidobacteria bacterium]|nr:hypothetical protein [Acidobacteriota bacterium]